MKASRTKVRTCIYWLIISVFTITAIEISSRAAFRLKWGESYSDFNKTENPEYGVQTNQGLYRWKINPERHRWQNKHYIIHPYTGFTLKNIHLPMNRNMHRQNGNTIAVGLFGGSVALQSTSELQRILEDILKQRGSSKRVDVLIYAVPGFKQPQQLMQLAYALSLGKQFDIIVNLDGYNESVLPNTDNSKRGINPHYPRLWDLMLQSFYERTAASELNTENLRLRLNTYTEAANLQPYRYSALYGFIVRTLSDRTRTQIAELNSRLLKKPKRNTLEFVGPDVGEVQVQASYRDIVGNWERSSLMMHALTDQAGIEYIHFLQPNQHLPESKPLTDEEKQYVDKGQSKGQIVREIYPHLRKSGQKLKEFGVDFIDLTQVFRNSTDTLYRDACCHLNEKGNSFLAGVMAAHIVDAVKKPNLIGFGLGP